MKNKIYEEYSEKNPYSLLNEPEAPYGYISPMSDFFFKNFFAKGEHSKENLIFLLNAILYDQLGFEKITDLTLNPTEDKAENPNRKTTFYDIHCTTSSGHKLIVEMQKRYEPNFQDRIFFYGVEAIMRQDERGPKGEPWNYEIVPVVSIALCDFELPGFTDKPMAYFTMRDKFTNQGYGNQLQLIFIHMKNFTDDIGRCKTELEQIIYSLKNMKTIQTMDKIPFSREEGDFFDRLATKSRIGSLTREEREEYDRWLKHEYDQYLRDYHRMKEATQKGMAQGLEKGMAQGLEKGMAQGLEKGMEKGKMEEKWEMAKKLRKLGIDLETISIASGLSIEQLKDHGLV